MLDKLHHARRWLLVGLVLTLVAAPAAAEQQQEVLTYQAETIQSATRYATYTLADNEGGYHEFTVGFDAQSGEVLSVSDDRQDHLIGSTTDRQAALDGFHALVDGGIEEIHFSDDSSVTSSDPSILVVHQTSSPADDLLPASGSYDAVTSFPTESGRALLFWEDGELTEGRVFEPGVSGSVSALGIVIEIDCDITWDSENGLQINCKVKIRFTANVAGS